MSSKGTETGDWGEPDTVNSSNVVAQAAFHQAVFDWHNRGELPGTDLAQSLAEWKAVLALYESTVTRAPVDMGSFEPGDDLMQRLRAALEAV